MRLIPLALVAACILSAAQPAQKPPLTTVMYLVKRADAIADFQTHAGQTSIIAPQTFSMDAQGFVMGEVPAEVMRTAREKGIAVMPLVVNRGFNQPLMHTVLDAPESRARAIRYLLYYALRDGYVGFQFDYENIRYTYRDKFTLFFREAARAFHRHRLILSAAIVGRKSATRNAGSPGGWDNWSGVYDYAELGKYADFLSIMAYDEHGSSTDPGPVAGLPWVRAIAEYSAKTIPPRKVSLGVPFYGRQWEAAGDGKWRSRSTRYRDASTAMATAESRWDEKESSPHITFDSAGRRTELWYEDARSLRAKLQLARDMGFPGISAWTLGQEDPAFWSSLEGWQVRHPRAGAAPGTFEQRSKRAARMLPRGM
jgi:spore germination protein YaaH